MRSLVLVLALAACSHATPPLAAPPPAPAPPEVARAPHNPDGSCKSPLPVAVYAENRTGAHGDLCAAFNGAVAPIAVPSTVAAGSFTIRVALTKLETTPTASCEVEISLVTGGTIIAVATDGASHAQAGREAARDCVEAVINTVMTNQIVPAMLRLIATMVSP